MRTLGSPVRGAIWLAALLLAVVGCGGKSSSTTTASTSTTVDYDFGNNDPRKVTAFGDSITFGVLELQRRDRLTTSNNYPNQLQARLRGLDPAWTVTNRGVPGEHVREGLSRLAGVLALDKPGYVLIMEGTNDSTNCDDAQAIVNTLRSMINVVKANKSIPILGSIPPNFRNDPCAQDVAFKISVLAPGAAQAEGATFADIYNGMNNRSLFGLSPDRDPLHPNEQGYAVMANIWYQAMLNTIPGGVKVALRRRS